MKFIITLLINAGILLGMTFVLPSVRIKNYRTAILVALVIGLLNATLGMFLRFPMNVVTLGLISFIVHLLVTAIMIKLADKFFDDFEIKGFTPALIIALVMAVAGAII
ncbi:phage holin family protein [Pedobacter caeni]|uniref:Putative membrane protein n=1 Tax=Pedobacter caeni TaxID=288992 RepID=A0A1M5DK34_9SPHI|nr:phage holin family protein [Pedobacter caeni]SHF67264.1 putative membrane protein [Pedobacter caeni]